MLKSMKLLLVVEHYARTLSHGDRPEQEPMRKPVHLGRSPQLGRRTRAVGDTQTPCQELSECFTIFRNLGVFVGTGLFIEVPLFLLSGRLGAIHTPAQSTYLRHN
jgi:hypothetical protein